MTDQQLNFRLTDRSAEAHITATRTVVFDADTIVTIRTPQGDKETLLHSATVTFAFFGDTDDPDEDGWSLDDAIRVRAQHRLASGKWGKETLLPMNPHDPSTGALYTAAGLAEVVEALTPSWKPSLTSI